MKLAFGFGLLAAVVQASSEESTATGPIEHVIFLMMEVSRCCSLAPLILNLGDEGVYRRRASDFLLNRFWPNPYCSFLISHTLT